MCIKADVPGTGPGQLASGGSVGSQSRAGSLIGADIKHQEGGGRGEKNRRLVLGVSAQFTKRQEFSMLRQGDKVVKQVCGGSENNGQGSHQKLPRAAGAGGRQVGI